MKFSANLIFLIDSVKAVPELYQFRENQCFALVAEVMVLKEIWLQVGVDVANNSNHNHGRCYRNCHSQYHLLQVLQR